MRRKWHSEMWGGGIFSENVEKAITDFLSEDELKDAAYVRNVKNDIIDSHISYGVTPMEYFLFDFRNESNERRAKYLCNKHKDKLMIDAIGFDKYNRELRDKFAFYQRFKEFFKRDVCKITGPEDKAEFIKFCDKHTGFIAKPMGGMCGIGCMIIKVENNSEELYENLSSKGSWIIEELIIQHESMAQWNSSSVNTVRLPSFMNSTGFHVMKPFFRSGRTGSVVDNAAQGGMFAIVDEKKGMLATDGMNESGETFKKHPDSGITFKGWQIPQWKELLETAEKAHKLLADHPYIGWDFAYTDKGWVLIEGDWGQFLSEFSDHEGIKEKFEKLIEAK